MLGQEPALSKSVEVFCGSLTRNAKLVLNVVDSGIWMPEKIVQQVLGVKFGKIVAKPFLR